MIVALAGYLDEDLTDDLRRELELHLTQCRRCRVVYDSTRKTLRILTESRSFELPERASEGIVARIMAKLRQSDAKPPEPR
ncbi:MAG: anti-sigma factor family protein [Vicinamibacterales bacterium]